MGTIRYHTDPSGTFVRYEAKAIGSGSEAAQAELQDKYHKVSVQGWLSSIALTDNRYFSATANDPARSAVFSTQSLERCDGRKAR